MVMGRIVLYQFICMPKKHSRTVQYHKDNKKRRMRRVLQERLKRLSLSELTFRNWEGSDVEEESKCDHDSSSTRKKRLRKKQTCNFIQSLQSSIQTSCVFTLYGMITIDENALKNETKDQSLIKALFNFYSLNEVQINPSYLLLKIHKSKENYFPISYVIQRFKSYGDSYFYEMANKIDEIRSVFDKMMVLPPPPLFSEKQIQKFIGCVKGKPAMLRISPNLLIFTKQLLEIGEYSVSDVANQCLSYRSFVSDVFLADDYRGQVNKFFELYELGKRLRKGEVNQEQYIALARQREVEYIIKKGNNMVKVVTSKYNLAPGVGCWEIDNVIAQEFAVPICQTDIQQRKRQFLENFVGRGLNTLSKLTKVPQNLKKLNQCMVCSYKVVQEAV